MVKKAKKIRGKKKKAKTLRFKNGDVVAVFWKDITSHDHIKASYLKRAKFLNYITTVKPTITYGMVIDIVNGSLIIAQEYCTDIACDATMLETIPVGCISKVVMLKPGKEIKGEMY